MDTGDWFCENGMANYWIGYIFQEAKSDGIPARSADEEAPLRRRARTPTRSRPYTTCRAQVKSSLHPGSCCVNKIRMYDM